MIVKIANTESELKDTVFGEISNLSELNALIELVRHAPSGPYDDLHVTHARYAKWEMVFTGDEVFAVIWVVPYDMDADPGAGADLAGRV
ncbi:hypothetical protein JYT20_01135 [Rhodothermus sp. AH-315-K08]|nr:hypothetical protein [Rhodothermus sp. AH-315-K08]